MSRYLGQHFLKNTSAIKKIIAALELKSGDAVIEIGPGKGALTFPLLEECKKVGAKLITIEKDPELVEQLKSYSAKLTDTVDEFKNLEIIEGDALKLINSSTHQLINYKIVGNIPYYITGKLLRILGELITNNESLITNHQPQISNIVLMIQKEVAERVCAKPPKNNLLAAAVQFWAEPKILFTLKPNDFNPPPEVESAVIKLTPIPITNDQSLITNYYKLIHIIFKQPRKTLMNNLKDGLNLSKNEIENALKTLKIDPKSRPQNLSMEDIQAIDKVL